MLVPDFPEAFYGHTELAQPALTKEWLQERFKTLSRETYHDNYRISTGFWLLAKCAANAAIVQEGLPAEIAEGGEVIIGPTAKVKQDDPVGVSNMAPYLITNAEILQLIED